MLAPQRRSTLLNNLILLHAQAVQAVHRHIEVARQSTGDYQSAFMVRVILLVGTATCRRACTYADLKLPR